MNYSEPSTVGGTVNYTTKDSVIEEEWCTMDPHFPDYRISNLGRIYSIRSDIIMKQKHHRQGYREIHLSVNGVNKHLLVHRLVARYFLAQMSGCSEVNHKNGIKSDNRAVNLEWVTPEQNMRHALSNGYICKLDAETVWEIRRLREETDMTQKEIGELFGVKPNTINSILNRKRWSWLV